MAFGSPRGRTAASAPNGHFPPSTTTLCRMSISKEVSSGNILRRWLFAVLSAAVVLLVWASPASAHVDFLGSTPENVSTVPGPVSEVVLEYSGAADPIDSDFRIENSAGASLPISSVTNDGENKVVVTSAAPLPSGRTKVLWALRGADGHRMSGSVSFTVASAAATAPTTTVAVPQGSATVASPSLDELSTNESPDQVVSTMTTTDDGSAIAESVGVVARWTVYGSVLLTVGALAYLLWVHRGTRSEGRRIVFFIRRAWLVFILGAGVEWFAHPALRGSGTVGDLVSPSAWADLATSGFAIGTLLRIGGAALVLRFVAIEVVSDRPSEAAAVADLDWIVEPRERSSLLVDERSQATTLTRVRVESGPLALLGALLLIVSESFIGHTASI